MVVTRAVIPAAETLSAEHAAIVQMAGKALKTITHENVVITLPVAITLPDTHGLLALCKRGDLRFVQENALRQVGSAQLHAGDQIHLGLLSERRRSQERQQTQDPFVHAHSLQERSASPSLEELF